MPATYDQILVGGTPRFRKDKEIISYDDVPKATRQVLTLENIVDENGLEIVAEKGEYGQIEAKATTDAEPTADEKPAPAPDPAQGVQPPQAIDATLDLSAPARQGSFDTPVTNATADVPTAKFVSRTPQSDPGMGFKRVDGKTVDLFDGKTPHTHVKYVGGHMAPLSTANFKARTDAEIEAQLIVLGFEIVDFNKFETAPVASSTNNDGLEDEKTK